MPVTAVGAGAAGSRIDKVFIPREKADGELLNKDKCIEGLTTGPCNGEGLQWGWGGG